MILEDFINCTFTTIAPKDIKLYAKCFWAEKDERLKYFIDNVSSDCNIDRAELDFSEESLEVLDRWLVNHVECVKLTREEYELKRELIPDYINIDDWRFSDDTFSNIINVGLYLGEVMIHKHPDLKWEQHLNGKKCARDLRSAPFANQKVTPLVYCCKVSKLFLFSILFL